MHKIPVFLICMHMNNHTNQICKTKATHLRRQAHAHLFLDTFYYGAHSTATVRVSWVPPFTFIIIIVIIVIIIIIIIIVIIIIIIICVCAAFLFVS
jgi:hypothetical protein